MLVVEDDSVVAGFRCALTDLPVWPQIRVPFLRMIMSDQLYGAKLTGKSSSNIPVSRAIMTLARSLSRNLRYQWIDRCKAPICIMGEGVANQWLAGRWFNRLTDHFVSLCPRDTLVIEDHFEWRWPFPRHHNRVLLHAPLQTINVIEGRLRVREHHRQSARQLVSLVTQRAWHFLQWSPGRERYDQLVEMLARKIASLPSQYAAYLAMLKRIQPHLLMVGAACYGPSACLIAAAKSQGIVTAEYQHGAVSAGHDAYNFALSIRDSEEYRRTLPDYFLGYGNWWNEQINAPVQKLVIGNPHRSLRLAEINPSVCKKSDLLVLSDGIEFDLYLEFARQLSVVAQKKGWRVVLRPHPLERTRVSLLSGMQTRGVVIDENPDLYASLSMAHVVVSEVSTGLFEAVGLVDKIFVWDTPKSKFGYPNHPFRSAESASMLIELLEQEEYGGMTKAQEDAIWASGWSERYALFLQSNGIRCIE